MGAGRNFVRIVRASFGASLLTTFWDRREALHQSHLVESATDIAINYHLALDRLQAFGMSPLQAAGWVMRQIETQFSLLSSLDHFYFSSWAALAVIPLVLANTGSLKG